MLTSLLELFSWNKDSCVTNLMRWNEKIKWKKVKKKVETAVIINANVYIVTNFLLIFSLFLNIMIFYW